MPKGITAEIVALHKKHPEWGATLIANELNCNDALVRTVAQRRNFTLNPSPRGAVPTYGATWIKNKRANGRAT